MAASHASTNGHTVTPAASKTTTTTTATDAAPVHKPLTLSSMRTAVFFLYTLQSAFFSTGNISSISSFSLDAVYRLLPIFDPFSQGALLLLKIIAPFFFLSVILALLNLRLGLAPGALYGVVSAAGEWLTIRFFWSVRDEGSWLEIGESITRFVIASLLGVFVAGLEVAGRAVVKGVEFEQEADSAVQAGVRANTTARAASGKTARGLEAVPAKTVAAVKGALERSDGEAV